MKTYVLIVSRTFPSTHKRKGDETYFVEKILNELNDTSFQYQQFDRIAKLGVGGRKLHTIRGNYPLWKKRFEEIEKGEACLSLRYWSGKPYKSKQVEIARLTRGDGIGLQKLKFPDNDFFSYDFNMCIPYICTKREGMRVVHPLSPITLSKNDGLAFEDFKEWFKGYDLGEPMALVHFTGFRY